jgi:DNA-binding NarL/FixJ family response regulator
MERVRVVVQATDPISAAGLTSHLGQREEFVVVPADLRGEADVAVVAADQLSPEVVSALRRVNAETGNPVVLVVNHVEERDVLAAVECGVVGILPRAAATGDRLAGMVKTAATDGGVLPPQLLGELLKHVERLRHDLTRPGTGPGGGLSEREVEVLRHVADGLDTGQIAAAMNYSERTVKNVLSACTTRLNLRNRPHAVAYAMRTGML